MCSLPPRPRAETPAKLNLHVIEGIWIWIGDVSIDICNMADRFPPDSVEKLTAALVDAQVDLNPHQSDAALLVH